MSRSDSQRGAVALLAPPPQNDPHGALRLGLSTYGAGFRAIGRRVRIIEYGSMDARTIRELQSPDIDLLFSDGGWAHTISVASSAGMQPLPRIINKPVIQLLCDNPCAIWLTGATGQDDPRQTTAALDSDFLTLWSRWTAPAGRRLTYVPACPAVTPLPDAERTIDRLVVLLAHRPERIRDTVIADYQEPVALKFFDGVADLGLSDSVTPLSEICDAVLRSLNAEIQFNVPRARHLVYLADQFIRARRRRIMLERLASVPVTLVGGGENIRVHPATQIIPPVDPVTLLDFYRRSRTVVISPPYGGGISERITHAMAAGAAVVAPPTSLSDRLMGRNRLFATVAADFSDVAQALERIADAQTRTGMAGAAHAYATRVFSPEATVRGLLAGKPDYPDCDAFFTGARPA